MRYRKCDQITFFFGNLFFRCVLGGPKWRCPWRCDQCFLWFLIQRDLFVLKWRKKGKIKGSQILRVKMRFPSAHACAVHIDAPNTRACTYHVDDIGLPLCGVRTVIRYVLKKTSCRAVRKGSAPDCLWRLKFLSLTGFLAMHANVSDLLAEVLWCIVKVQSRCSGNMSRGIAVHVFRLFPPLRKFCRKIEMSIPKPIFILAIGFFSVLLAICFPKEKVVFRIGWI